MSHSSKSRLKSRSMRSPSIEVISPQGGSPFGGEASPSQRNTLLLASADSSTIDRLKAGCAQAGWSVVTVSDGFEATKALEHNRVATIIVDYELAPLGGLELCKMVRKRILENSIPVIVLSTVVDSRKILLCLECGADECLESSVTVRELLLRLRALNRRSKAASNEDHWRLGPLEVDVSKCQVQLSGGHLFLTMTEYRLLISLIRRMGRVVSRECLLLEVWGHCSDVGTRTVDTHLRRLRSKLGPVADTLTTVRGFGYRFDPPVA